MFWRCTTWTSFFLLRFETSFLVGAYTGLSQHVESFSQLLQGPSYKDNEASFCLDKPYEKCSSKIKRILTMVECLVGIVEITRHRGTYLPSQ
uniref:Unclassified n=1 Tax=Fusarium clavum TaxID=2594811 RepID=W1I9R2_9HYPO|nr:unclassified [Fusarium clavum]CEF82672.1 unclassified [Fusarium clavum]